MKKSLLVLIICSFFFVFELSVNGKSPENKKSVTVKILTKDLFHENLTFEAFAVPYNERVLKADISFKIFKTYVVNNEWVEKGKRLFMIDRAVILNKIKSSEEEINGWEKILSERKKWKKRNRSLENDALKKIEFSKKFLKTLNYYKDNPYIVSPISGRITVLLRKGDRVRENSVLAKITDNYIVKIGLSDDISAYFKIGESVNLKLGKTDKKIFSARVKSDKSGRYLLVNNAKLLIHSGDKVFFDANKAYDDSILLDNDDILSLNGNNYIYKVKNGWAKRVKVSVKLLTSGKYLLLSGLNEGEIIVSPVQHFKDDRVRVNIVEKLTVSDKKKEVKNSVSEQDVKTKKTEFVISSGLSLSKPVKLNYRFTGTRELLSQYSKHYELDDSQSGVFKENYLGIPFAFTVNYSLNSDIILKGGIEFDQFRNNSLKNYTLKWESVEEKYNFTFKDKITNIMPFVGIEKTLASFAVYVSAGLSFTSIKQSETLDYISGSYSSSEIKDYSIKGKGLSLIIGGKYIIKIGKNNKLLIKAEFVTGKISGFSGTKNITSSDSSGKNISDSVTGSVYTYEYNPYDISWFGWWELSKELPASSVIRNVKEFSMNFSRIRLIIGFAF